MKVTLIFEEPPPRSVVASTPRLDYGAHLGVAAALRLRPGEWARVGAYMSPETSASVAYAIKSAVTRAYLPAGSFEAVARTVEGENRVYARYVGGGSS